MWKLDPRPPPPPENPTFLKSVDSGLTPTPLLWKKSTLFIIYGETTALYISTDIRGIRTKVQSYWGYLLQGKTIGHCLFSKRCKSVLNSLFNYTICFIWNTFKVDLATKCSIWNLHELETSFKSSAPTSKLTLRRYLMDELLHGLTIVHPSKTDYISKNKFDQFLIWNGWVNYSLSIKSLLGD